MNDVWLTEICYFQKEIATSGYLVASFLQSIDFQQTVYLIGSKGFAEELGNHGIKHTQIGVNTNVSSILK